MTDIGDVIGERTYKVAVNTVLIFSFHQQLIGTFSILHPFVRSNGLQLSSNADLYFKTLYQILISVFIIFSLLSFIFFYTTPATSFRVGFLEVCFMGHKVFNAGDKMYPCCYGPVTNAL
jgi:uncharacterized membrane protein